MSFKSKATGCLRAATTWLSRAWSDGRGGYASFTASLAGVFTLLFCLSDVVMPLPESGVWVNLALLAASYFATWAIMAAAALWRPVFAIFMPVYALVYAAVTYFRYTLGIVIDRSTIELTFGTDIGTSMSMLSTPLLFTLAMVLCCAVCAVVVRWRSVRVRGARWQWLLMSAAVIGLTGFVQPLATMMCKRQPYNVPSAVTQHLTSTDYPRYYRFNFDFTDAVTDEDSLTVVFLLGESVRADHLGLNGYARQTTPFLSREPNVVSISDVYSPSYFTDRAVPRMMTRADSIDDHAAYDEQSFITLFKNAGFRTSWYANQADTPCLRYYRHETDRLYEAEHNFVPNTAKGKFLDEDLLGWYRKDLRRTDEPLQLLIMHQLNCHWVYTSKYPDSFEIYKPVMTHDEVLRNTREELINAYDNCIVYSDSIWHEVIEPLRGRNAIVIYHSDHGEALGEEGKYLHGADYPGTHCPAAWVWYSDTYARRHPARIAALRANAGLPVTSTWLFHTILDAASIRTKPLQPRQSLMRPMRAWSER